jgi:hypothetical protein
MGRCAFEETVLAICLKGLMNVKKNLGQVSQTSGKITT